MKAILDGIELGIFMSLAVHMSEGKPDLLFKWNVFLWFMAIVVVVGITRRGI